MANLNRVFLIGNLTRDPELRYAPSGAAVTNFSLAVNTPIFKPNSEPKEDVCFIRIVVWGKQAESCKQYLSKGRPVFVEGRLIYRSWEQDGKTRSTLEVRADRVQFLGSRRDEPGAGARAVGAPVASDEAPMDTPPTDEIPEDEPPF